MNLLSCCRRDPPKDPFEYSVSQGDFRFPHCWQFGYSSRNSDQMLVQLWRQICDQQIIQGRITYPDPKGNPCLAVLDGCIQITVPTPHFIKKVMAFWKREKRFAGCKVVVAGSFLLTMALGGKKAAALIATYNLYLAIAFCFAVAVSATLTLLSFAIDLHRYKQASREIPAWQQIQIKLSKQPDLLNRVAAARKEILQAYMGGFEIAESPKKKGLWNLCLDHEERLLLLQTGVEKRFESSMKKEVARKVRAKYLEHYDDETPSGKFIWDYAFPSREEWSFQPVT